MSNSPKARPNILVVMSDQHSPYIAGCYGDSLLRSPNMDQLAQEGMRMDRCYCPSPICVPSRMSFMTGRRPCENGVSFNHEILSSSIMTWPERLREVGYHTALIGRMHFEGPDQFHGFETTVEELRHWRNDRPVENQQVSQRVPENSYWSARDSMTRHSGAGTTFVQYRDEVVCENACSFLDQAGKGTEPRPFAAVVGFYQPHPPYIGRPDLYEHYRNCLPDCEPPPNVQPEYLRRFNRLNRDWHLPEAIDADSIRRSRAAYYANCEHLDSLLGKVLNALDQSGLAENTVVIYCSDHGNLIGEKGLWGKRLFYEESVRVPFLVRFPNVIQPKSRCSTNMNLRDLANTFCEIAGAPPLSGSDAPSRWPIFQGKQSGREGYYESESEIVFCPRFKLKDYVAARMVVSGDWKIWAYDWGTHCYYSLFHLGNDPHEHNDLSEKPEYGDRLRSLKAVLYKNWDPTSLIKATARRETDRQELNKAWHNSWLQAGYPVPGNLDADVQTPHAKSIQC